MPVTDQKIIEFFWKSPVRSFAVMGEVLGYLDSRACPEEVEFELFDSVRVPDLGGDSAAAVWKFTRHAEKMGMVRRRARQKKSPLAEAPELLAVYEITQNGRWVMGFLEAIRKTKAAAQTSA